MNGDYLCGLSFWHPKWLQKCATMKWFLGVYGLLGTVQAISSTYLIVTLTTMEKQFHMPSQTTGIVLSGNEISQILLSLILSYAGGQKNRPLWIAWGMVFCGLSCLVLALPHFIYGVDDETFHLTKEYYDSIDQQWNTTFLNKTATSLINKNQPLCKAFQDEEQCKKFVTIVPLILIFLSQFILGVGNTLYYSLGQTFLDDNTKKTNTPLLFAFAMALRMIGPIIGFGLGTGSLKLFVDPTKTPLISSKDPRWLGAWWFGWIIIGLIMFIFSGLLALFPKQLFTSQQLTLLSNNSEKDSRKTTIETEEHSLSVQDFFASLRRVLRNRIVILNNISGIFYILGASGYFTYLGHYMEIQFNKTSQDATSFVGPISIFGMVIGFFVSGWILSKRRPSVSKVLFWNVIVGCVYAIGQFSYMFFYCDNGAGSAMNVKEWSSMSSECSQNCHCDNIKYSPVCHQSSGRAFFSPCSAGCYSWNRDENIYTNCTCIGSIEKILQMSSPDVQQKFSTATPNLLLTSPEDTTLTPGLCTKDCKLKFYAFSLFTMLMTWLNSTGKIGNILVNYRAVAERDKAFTQGLTLMMLSLFAFIPGPIIFGRVIDSTCLLWNFSCGRKGNCLHYDQNMLRYYMSCLAVVLTICGVFFDSLVWYYGRTMDLYMESEEIDGTNETKPENKEATAPLIESNILSRDLNLIH